MLKLATVEECFNKLGLDPNVLPDLSAIPERFQKRMIADYKLMVVFEAHNEGWVPNYNDDDQRKYFPYFEVEADAERPAGFGFSCTLCGRWSTVTNVGSRLCTYSSDMAIYLGKQFKDLYIDQQLS